MVCKHELMMARRMCGITARKNVQKKKFQVYFGRLNIVRKSGWNGMEDQILFVCA